MTRVLCPRSCRRKPSNISQEREQEDGMQNVTSHVIKKSTAKNKSTTSMKENISPSSTKCLKFASMNNCTDTGSPIRKSNRRTILKKGLKTHTKSDKNVLCDKTNTPLILDNVTSPSEQSEEVPVLKTTENKNNMIHKLIYIPKLNVNGLSKKQVPVYNTSGNLQDGPVNKIPSIDKKEEIYEFEVDENEEPVQKKKCKKRVYNRKPKIGPKALTINNIKYSSTESLVSLPEKPKPRKKKTRKTTKTNLKSSPNTKNTDVTCSSTNSLMSPPSSTVLGINQQPKVNKKLSVVFECQSENSQSHVETQDDPSQFSSPSSCSADQVIEILCDPRPQASAFTPKHRSYSASNGTSFQQASPCPTNTSSATTHDFLSSTPCKRVSAVVCSNSMFEDSLDIPNSVRQSTGYVRNTQSPMKNTVDNCFGFDEPEELEEPLVSPIKNNVDLHPRWAGKKVSPQPILVNELDAYKPSTQEVIEMLKASIPKDIPKQLSKEGFSDVFDIETDKANVENSFLQENVDEVVETSFRKPPRRSYERQRQVRYHHSETEEESEIEDSENPEKEEVKEKVVKGGKKCYKRTNTTKSAKQPKVTKAKQREAKEVEEMERLAAMMNAQFQEIDKVSLVVE